MGKQVQKVRDPRESLAFILPSQAQNQAPSHRSTPDLSQGVLRVPPLLFHHPLPASLPFPPLCSLTPPTTIPLPSPAFTFYRESLLIPKRKEQFEDCAPHSALTHHPNLFLGVFWRPPVLKVVSCIFSRSSSLAPLSPAHQSLCLPAIWKSPSHIRRVYPPATGDRGPDKSTLRWAGDLPNSGGHFETTGPAQNRVWGPEDLSSPWQKNRTWISLRWEQNLYYCPPTSSVGSPESQPHPAAFQTSRQLNLITSTGAGGPWVPQEEGCHPCSPHCL